MDCAGDFAACGRRVTLPAAAKSPKRRRGRLRMDTPCPYSPYPGPQMRGLPLEVGRTFPARKTRSAWVRLNPGPLGPWVYKVRFYCGFQTAPGFPSQRSRPVFRRRGAQCAPASLPPPRGKVPSGCEADEGGLWNHRGPCDEPEDSAQPVGAAHRAARSLINSRRAPGLWPRGSFCLCFRAGPPDGRGPVPYRRPNGDG